MINVESKKAKTEKMMSDLLHELGVKYYEGNKNNTSSEFGMWIDKINECQNILELCEIYKQRKGNQLICSSCGAQVPTDSIFCNKCGESIPQYDFSVLEEVEEEKPVNNYVTDREVSRVMFCEKCGSELVEGAMFCEKCGAHI